MVIPTGWDHRGRPTDVMIAAFDENEYHIEKNALADELFNILRKVVVVQGSLQIKGGRKWIEIDRYEVVG